MIFMTEFLFGTWPGLVLTSILGVLAICLTALPFLILNRLNQILGVLHSIDAGRKSQTLATINKNVGWIVLNLPKLLKAPASGA